MQTKAKQLHSSPYKNSKCSVFFLLSSFVFKSSHGHRTNSFCCYFDPFQASLHQKKYPVLASTLKIRTHLLTLSTWHTFSSSPRPSSGSDGHEKRMQADDFHANGTCLLLRGSAVFANWWDYLFSKSINTNNNSPPQNVRALSPTCAMYKWHNRMYKCFFSFFLREVKGSSQLQLSVGSGHCKKKK